MAQARAQQMVAVDIPFNAPSKFPGGDNDNDYSNRRHWLSIDQAAKLYHDLGVALGLI